VRARISQRDGGKDGGWDGGWDGGKGSRSRSPSAVPLLTVAALILRSQLCATTRPIWCPVSRRLYWLLKAIGDSLYFPMLFCALAEARQLSPTLANSSASLTIGVFEIPATFLFPSFLADFHFKARSLPPSRKRSRASDWKPHNTIHKIQRIHQCLPIVDPNKICEDFSRLIQSIPRPIYCR
jgi:hypothetical protein